MKKILIFVLCLMPFALMGQSSNVRMTVEGKTASFARGLDALSPTGIGEFNILKYGATSGGTVEDQTAIQAAIDAAVTYGGGVSGYGGIVIIPAGRWYISDSIQLKNNVYVRCDKGAYFTIVSDYAGSVWYGAGLLHHSGVTGGYYRCDTFKHTVIRLFSNTYDNWIGYNTFRDMFFYNCKIGIKLTTSSTGWINANVFDNIVISRPIIGIDPTMGVGSSGIDGNLFSNCQIQTNTTTIAAIDTLDGSFNSFTNFNIWDWGVVAPPGSHTFYLTTNATRNYLQGMDLTPLGGYHDDGYQNTIISDGRINMLDSLNIMSKYPTSGGTLAVPSGDAGIRFASYYEDALSLEFSAAIVTRNMSIVNHGSQLVFKTHAEDAGESLNDAMIIDYNKGIVYPPVNSGTVATSITATILGRIIYYNEAAVTDLSADSQIVAGRNGQMITIIGSSDTNTLTLDDGTGLALSAQCILGIDDSITLVYMTTRSLWVEVSRSNN